MRALLLLTCAAPVAALTCDPMAHGAAGDGSRYDTDAVRAAVAECGAAGGGTVLFAAGRTFLTGSFNVTAHTRLQVDGTLRASPNATGYVLQDFLPWYGPDPPQALARAAAGAPADSREWSPFIGSWYADNVSIVGSGTIDGAGAAWWGCVASGTTMQPPCSGYPRPHGIRLVGGSGHELAGFTMRDSPMWQIHLAFTTGVWVHDVTVLAPAAAAHNTDGIDPDCAQDVLVERVHISTGDDAIAIKSGRNWYGRTFGRPSRNITVRDSTFGTGHGLSIGSEMSGGVYDVLFDNLTSGLGADGAALAAGARIKSERGRGGLVANVTYRNIVLHNVGQGVQITMNYDPGLAPTNATATPAFRNITLDNFTVAGAKYGYFIDGLPEAPLDGIALRGVSIRNVSAKNLFEKCDYVAPGTSSCDAATEPACPPCFSSATAAPPLPTWFGIRAVDPASPSAWELVVLADNATVVGVVGRLALAQGETPLLDAMRCLPGFCVFAVSTATGGSAVYRVGNANATTQWRAACAGLCGNVHFDIPSETVVALSQAPGLATVVGFAAGNGTARVVGDVTAALAGARVGPGQTSHCSATRHVYVGVGAGGASSDAVLSFSLATGTVDATTPLVGAPLPAALWAACDANGFLGGLSARAGALTFGVFAANGSYTESARVAVPAGFAPTGLLTATSDRGASGNLFFATVRGPSGAVEAAWVVDPWGTGAAQDALTDFSYDLVAASWDRSNW
jgi:polygalacturonase